MHCNIWTTRRISAASQDLAPATRIGDMNIDKFPYRLLAFRLLDVLIYAFVVILTMVLVMGYFADAVKIGIAILVTGLYQESRQQSFYSRDLHESDLLSNRLTRFPINEIARARARLSKTNIVLIISGTILSGWSAFASP